MLILTREAIPRRRSRAGASGKSAELEPSEGEMRMSGEGRMRMPTSCSSFACRRHPRSGG
jgi:hypothetical protein